MVAKSKKSSLPIFIPDKILICDSLEKSLQLMTGKLEKKTIQCYTCTVGFFIKVIKELKWDKSYLHELQSEHIEKVMESIADKRSWSNNEYNKNITYIKAVFSKLVDAKYIKENPAHGISSRKKNKRKGYIRLTDKEQTRVITHFKKVNPNYATWLKALYHTGMRPDELRNVRCSMIDIENEVFRLNEDITKTDDNRVVPIPDDLMKDLSKLNLSNSDWFLFGKSHCRSKDISFLPAKFQIDKNAAAKVWRDEVIKKLNIDKKMYSNKHCKFH